MDEVLLTPVVALASGEAHIAADLYEGLRFMAWLAPGADWMFCERGSCLRATYSAGLAEQHRFADSWLPDRRVAAVSGLVAGGPVPAGQLQLQRPACGKQWLTAGMLPRSGRAPSPGWSMLLADGSSSLTDSKPSRNHQLRPPLNRACPRVQCHWRNAGFMQLAAIVLRGDR